MCVTSSTSNWFVAAYLDSDTLLSIEPQGAHRVAPPFIPCSASPAGLPLRPRTSLPCLTALEMSITHLLTCKRLRPYVQCRCTEEGHAHANLLKKTARTESRHLCHYHAQGKGGLATSAATHPWTCACSGTINMRPCSPTQPNHAPLPKKQYCHQRYML